jgi:uncharacterized protein
MVAIALANLRRHPGHEFWPDDLSFFDTAAVDTARIFSPRQVTDIYLLALAKTHGGRLATFDRRLPVGAVTDGQHALFQIPSRPE